jgi:hypothetical protein
VRRIDRVCRVEQAPIGGLLDESLEDIVDDVFETGEKPVNRVSDDIYRVSGGRFV